MSGLVYFFEGPRTMSAARAAELGLAYALSGGTAHRGGTGGGGKIGVLFTRSGGSPGQRPRWEPYPGQEGLYLGWDPEDPPGPADFARDEFLEGHPVKLGDGAEWIVPVARYPSGAAPFPRKLSWDGADWSESGEPADPEHRKLWSAACGYWDEAVRQEEGKPITIRRADVIELAASALSLNYRIGPAEMSVLGLMNSKVPNQVCLALIDWPSVLSMAASIEEGRESPNSEEPTQERGQQESSGTTDQPSLISTLSE